MSCVQLYDSTSNQTGEKTTQKAHRKASKPKNDDNWKYCDKTCFHDVNGGDKMVQCNLCQSWFHAECVWEEDREIVAIWVMRIVLHFVDSRGEASPPDVPPRVSGESVADSRGEASPPDVPPRVSGV